MTHATEAAALSSIESNDAILNDLLGELGDDTILEGAAGDELDGLLEETIVESDGNMALSADASDTLLESVEEDAARAEAKQAIYANQPAGAGIVDGTAPETTAEAVAEATEPAKGKGKRAAKPKEPKEPKAPRATSVTHSPGDLLKVKLGEKANDFLVFNMADAMLPADELQAKIDAFIERMNDRDAIADKVREKMSMFLLWMVRGGDLNEVMKRALNVLHAHGELTSGDKGNLQLNLLEKPYSMGTARSQANQMFMAFPELGLVIKEKGRMVPNPDSTLLPMAYAKLGLE